MKRIILDVQDANSGVTGSCELLTIYFPEPILASNGYTKTISFMVDCGIAQGDDEKNGYINPFYNHIPLEDISFIILTHAHLDHYGNIPCLIKNGFYNPIFTTQETKTFLENVSLDDCLKIQKKAAKHTHTEPLFEEKQINMMKEMMVGCLFEEKIPFNDNICFYFFPNGHVPGAAIILVRISCPGYEPINLLFTGDYKQQNRFFKVSPLPDWVKDLPLTIISEATYGTTNSTDINSPCLINNVANFLSEQKRVLIPTFSFNRTQEVLADINEAKHCGKIPLETKIFLDGVTAQENTRLYLKGVFKLLPQMQNFIPQNTDWVCSKLQRKEIIATHEPFIVVTSSGMISYGPSQEYCKHFINDAYSVIHLSGYCSPESTAGKLKSAKLGDIVTIGGICTFKLCNIYETAEYSGHAKADELILFYNQFKIINSILFRHGDPLVKKAFAKRVKEEVKVYGNIAISSIDNIFRLTSDGIVSSIPTKLL